jgi:hypothetical protein
VSANVQHPPAGGEVAAITPHRTGMEDLDDLDLPRVLQALDVLAALIAPRITLGG